MLDGRREIERDEDFELVVGVELVVELVVGAALLVVDGGGGGVVEEVVDVGSAALEDPFVPEPAFEFPTSKTTMFAVWPLGIVTTQKEDPPAPTAWSALVTPPIPFTEGSIEHGVPLQPSPAQVILMPKVGGVLARGELWKMGFQPSLKKVLPFASVFPPAT